MPSQHTSRAFLEHTLLRDKIVLLLINIAGDLPQTFRTMSRRYTGILCAGLSAL